MTEFVLKQISPTTLTYRIRNFESINYEFNAPVTPLPLPEDEATKTILVKVEGNTEVITITYIIKTEETTVVDEQADLKDSQAIMQFLLNSFVPTSINHKYSFTMGDGANILTRFGTFTKLVFIADKSNPQNWTATLTFIVGDVISVVVAEDS